MSGASLPTCTEKSRSRLRLQRPDAEDEEGAKADREQDHARLVAAPPHVQHGVPQRKRTRVTQRLHRADENEPATCSTTATATNPTDRTTPTVSEPACHEATPTSAAATAAGHDPLQPVESSGRAARPDAAADQA